MVRAGLTRLDDVGNGVDFGEEAEDDDEEEEEKKKQKKKATVGLSLLTPHGCGFH